MMSGAGGGERYTSAQERVRVPKPYEQEGSPELERAKDYWKKTLTGEVRIETPLDPRCEMAVVIPVQAEDTRRLARQLDSVRAQKDLEQGQYELIYVVNNGPDDGSDRSLRVRAKNIHALAYLCDVKDVPLRVIDKSSPGHAIPACNIGKARNRGVAEAGVRFYEQSKNGIVLQTDADSWFEDPNHFSKVLRRFREDATVIGIAGGKEYIWDPDEVDPEKRRTLEKQFERLQLWKQYKLLYAFLTGSFGPEDILHRQPQFSGCHMITGSMEAAAVGGLRDVGQKEDLHFGEALTKFAGTHDVYVVSDQSLQIATSFRESDRTEYSFGSLFRQLEDNPTLRVPDGLAHQSLHEFRQALYARIHTGWKLRDGEFMRELTDKAAKGSIELPVDLLERIHQKVQDGTYTGSRKIARDLNIAYTGRKSLVESLYDATYPAVELTSEYVRRMKQMASSRPGGEDVVKEVERRYAKIRMAPLSRVY